MSKIMETFQYRVEHLFTCELDGKEVQSVADCVERLKLLDGVGRVWGQNMLLEVHGSSLRLSDIETRVTAIIFRMCRVPRIVDLQAMMDGGVYNSLLTMCVEDRRVVSVFLFHSGNPEFMAGPTRPSPPPKPRDWNPPEDPVSTWNSPDYEDDEDASGASVPLMYREEDAPSVREEPPSSRSSVHPEEDIAPMRPYTELDRNVVCVEGLPPVEDFATCLQKIKCGFNLLAQLDGKISNPSSPDFVHCLFSTLSFVITRCPKDFSFTVVAPLLTPDCFRLLSEEATAEEDQLWQSLGDPWNIPSTKWPEDDDDIPTYSLEFSDGWQPPKLMEGSPVGRPARRQESPAGRPLGGQENPEESEPRYMRVMYDFTARNSKELSITKGEIVTLLDVSKKWWKVRNVRGDQGYIPSNVVESLEPEPLEVEEFTGPPVLAKRSKPAEVKAWLEYKGFSRITVRCLGPLSGSMLLGMSREEMKTVCPEEGGRVFFQLQSVKSALAVSDRMPCVPTRHIQSA
ncbi:hypothetical protein NHX12_030804 [Muraenolepis orangiensis]|uniref:SH3 domain-containing protein n=1 Tax=Muraenolepis orangiensis TaxID=630683 RepID=A0A9Q0E9D0_9TELE|nr:hypothetical protein NHX12_030804 [Muraenolepis orangiensis]